MSKPINCTNLDRLRDHLRRIDATLERKLAKSEYIPHYSSLAEAGWAATRAVIAEVLRVHEADCRSLAKIQISAKVREREPDMAQFLKRILEPILTAFESLDMEAES